jgi:hypothetical protein
MEAWGKDSSLRKKKSTNQDISEPSEVRINITFTDEVCLAKVEKYPWWPAKKGIAKDENLAQSLESLGRNLVSGESQVVFEWSRPETCFHSQICFLEKSHQVN